MKINKYFHLYGKKDEIIFEEVPTIEAEPTKHGRWEQVGDNTYRCSVCGEISCCNSPFCSECGAKMEGEQNG